MYDDILPTIILGILFLLPLVLILLDIINLCRRRQKLVLEAISFSIGLVYMVLGWWLWDLPNFTTPINLYGSSSMLESFNGAHMPTLLNSFRKKKRPVFIVQSEIFTILAGILFPALSKSPGALISCIC